MSQQGSDRNQRSRIRAPRPPATRPWTHAAVDLGMVIGILGTIALQKEAIAIALLGTMAMRLVAELAVGPARRGR